MNLSGFRKTFCFIFIALNVIFLDSRCVEGRDNPAINAGAAVVMDMDSGRLLFAKNQHEKRPMASTTKIMTAILAIEYGNLDAEVSVSKRASRIGGSVMHLKEGEKCSVRELLYGLLLPSGNDAAIALAEHIAGSVEEFVEMMNHKAWIIGARNTQFKNPHGLDTDGHYSTAYDMAVIARYALCNDLFSKIVSTGNTTIGNRSLYNTNEMLGSYPGSDGVKTGYTGKAGRCLVTSATRNEKRLVSVVLFCQSRYQRANSSRIILDYAFREYSDHILAKQGDIVANLPVLKGKKQSVNVCTEEKLVFPLAGDECKNVDRVLTLPDSIEAPVYAGVDVGTVTFMLHGEVIAQTKLKAWETVDKKTVYDYFMDLINGWLGIYRPQ